jgi:hypothetical protein
MVRRLLALAVVPVILLLACKDDHDHGSEPASCTAIVDACHPKDTGSGPIHECHEFAESGKTESECAAKKAECLSTCSGSPADAGPG